MSKTEVNYEIVPIRDECLEKVLLFYKNGNVKAWSMCDLLNDREVRESLYDELSILF